MHDCHVTRELLIDLAFDEAGEDDALRAEAEACPACRAELREIAETLRGYARACTEDDPPAQFWHAYQARLSARLCEAAQEHAASVAEAPSLSTRAGSPHTASAARPSSFAARPSSFDARLLTARLLAALNATWRVPAPVAVAAVLFVACLSVLAIRGTPEPVAVNAPAQNLAQSPAPASAEVRTVEVPVERVVTRVVYVGRGSRATHQPHFESTRVHNDALARREDARLDARADTLAGFRPAGDVRLRVVKGSYEDEK